MNTKHLIFRNPGRVLAVLLFSALMAIPSSMMAGSMIRVLQFNIRLTSSSDGNNIWYNRQKDVLTFVHDNHPDVFGLQEATYPQMKNFINSMKEYGYVGQGRDGGTSGEWCPVFYLKAKYEVLNSGTFWLSDTPDVVGSNTWGAACRRILTWAVLKNKETGEEFLYGNTHLDHRSTVAQENSPHLIKERLQGYAEGRPIIVTGDFNVTPTSKTYSLMISSDEFFPMYEAWQHGRATIGNEGTFHSFGSIAVENRSRIDFIFMTTDLRCLRCVTDDETSHPRLLSDHNPVYAEIELP